MRRDATSDAQRASCLETAVLHASLPGDEASAVLRRRGQVARRRRRGGDVGQAARVARLTFEHEALPVEDPLVDLPDKPGSPPTLAVQTAEVAARDDNAQAKAGFTLRAGRCVPILTRDTTNQELLASSRVTRCVTKNSLLHLPPPQQMAIRMFQC